MLLNLLKKVALPASKMAIDYGLNKLLTRKGIKTKTLLTPALAEAVDSDHISEPLRKLFQLLPKKIQSDIDDSARDSKETIRVARAILAETDGFLAEAEKLATNVENTID